jgi:hypothetical protein
LNKLLRKKKTKGREKVIIFSCRVKLTKFINKKKRGEEWMTSMFNINYLNQSKRESVYIRKSNIYLNEK